MLPVTNSEYSSPVLYDYWFPSFIEPPLPQASHDTGTTSQQTSTFDSSACIMLLCKALET